ncbi:hypothetical protein MUK42_17157 [Musa troglodytarum]|uniref:Uncharacterized protein n=1 Tax=Musa troglodytarum TaxID=320322 RepID=A0A9E7ICQ7_9LILI|nr:hypothetical protein MUK42_17157 [Musa troglodytarum]
MASERSGGGRCDFVGRCSASLFSVLTPWSIGETGRICCGLFAFSEARSGKLGTGGDRDGDSDLGSKREARRSSFPRFRVTREGLANSTVVIRQMDRKGGLLEGN